MIINIFVEYKYRGVEIRKKKKKKQDRCLRTRFLCIYAVGRMKELAMKAGLKIKIKIEQVTTMNVVYVWAMKALIPYQFRIWLKIIVALFTIEYTYL